MKYLCLGYIEPGTFEGMTEERREHLNNLHWPRKGSQPDICAVSRRHQRHPRRELCATLSSAFLFVLVSSRET
jgi:hypothetical protein